MQIFHLFSLILFSLTLSAIGNTNDVHSLSTFEKRQKSRHQSKQEVMFQWPRIDGPPEEFPAEDIFETGYWTFNVTFIQRLLDLNKTDHLQAQLLAFQGSIEYELLWRDECFKLSNASAIIMQHKNTLARVIAFPDQDKTLNLDKKYQCAPAIKLLCMEREKGKNINKSVINHSKTLMMLFGWDKEAAEKNIKGIHQQLNKSPNLKSKSNSKQNINTTHTSKSNRHSKTKSKSKSKQSYKSMPQYESSPWMKSMPKPKPKPQLGPPGPPRPPGPPKPPRPPGPPGPPPPPKPQWMPSSKKW